MNILLLIVLIIFAVSGLIGMKAGLIKTVFSMFSFLVALLLTIFLSPYVSKLVQSNEKVMNYFTEKTGDVLKLDELGEKVSDQMDFINELPLPESMKKSLVENKKAGVSNAADNFADYIARSVAEFIINSLSFLITFLVLIISLHILCAALNIISKLPLLNQINKLTGLVAGLLHGLIIVWILCVVLTAFSGSEMGNKLYAMINQSQFLSYIYNNNLVARFIF